MKIAKRVAQLTSAIFNEMDRLRLEVIAQGVEVINLGIGSPDLPPAPHIKEALIRALDEPNSFGYPLSDGLPEFRQAVATWYKRRFGVELDPATEVLSLMGSQDGLAHIFLGLVDPGEVALIPDPGYPVYTAGLLLAEGVKYPLPLVKEKRFLPDLKQVPPEVARQARLMFLNYPNNPVAATADREFFSQVVEFAREYEVIVCHDLAYSELAFDGFKPMSFLEVPGAKEVGIEFHSVSKTYNMAGCRLGFAVGNPEVLSVLSRIKSNIDYGVFKAVQIAGVAALLGPQDVVRQTAATYQRRRDILLDGLTEVGWMIDKPKASMFVWAQLPDGFKSSYAFAVDLLRRVGVLVIPGIAFGEQGEGYVRMALVGSETQLQEAVRRIGCYL
ncbi:MAG: LL-diaminopimelate aminotransferase [Firmicutes bacterium]|nr:LL-diaminopimelate aminotransferase [Bacillota bacterium]